MKKIIIASIVVIMAISAGSAYAGHDKHRFKHSSFYDRARVTDVQPVYTTIRVEVPHEQCYQQEVRTHRHHNGNKAASTILGGIIGGAVGHNLGDHKRGPTIAGAIIGAAVGSELGKQRRHGREYVRYEDVCETNYSYEEEQRIDGYNVTYRYKGEYFTTYMKDHPGKRIRVKVHVSPVVD
jgi:uncharacterized protein YcfJ